MSRMFRQLLMMSLSKPASLLPQGYAQYDYLAKTDYRQLIDTGLGYSDKTEVELGFKMIDQITTGYSCLFGYIPSTAASNPDVDKCIYMRFVFGSAYNAALGNYTIQSNGSGIAGAIYRDPSQKYIYTLNKDGFYINGNKIKALTNVAEFSYNRNTLRLGRIGNVSPSASLFQIYSLRIRENGELVADYIPAKRNSDGKCGMYDLVSGTFKTDVSGYGEMECGND